MENGSAMQNEILNVVIYKPILLIKKIRDNFLHVIGYMRKYLTLGYYTK